MDTRKASLLSDMCGNSLLKPDGAKSNALFA